MTVNVLCIHDMNVVVVDVVCVASSGELSHIACICHRVLLPALSAGCKVSKVSLWRKHVRLVQGKANF